MARLSYDENGEHCVALSWDELCKLATKGASLYGASSFKTKDEIVACATFTYNIWGAAALIPLFELEEQYPEVFTGKLKLLRYRKKPIPPIVRWQVWERDDFTCQECGSRRHLAVDHIMPESKGGEATLENLQTLCGKCNRIKGARMPSEG